MEFSALYITWLFVGDGDWYLTFGTENGVLLWFRCERGFVQVSCFGFAVLAVHFDRALFNKKGKIEPIEMYQV